MANLRFDFAPVAERWPVVGSEVAYQSRGQAGRGAGPVVGVIARFHDDGRAAVRPSSVPDGSHYAIGSIYLIDPDRLTRPAPYAVESSGPLVAEPVRAVVAPARAAEPVTRPAAQPAPAAVAPARESEPVARPAAAVAPKRPAGPLTEQFRPRCLAEVRGQADAVNVLARFASNPFPCSFLMHGPTGTGKTSSARALAAELGVSVDDGPFGGFVEIASGEQTGESVREAVRQCHTRPMTGSGWKLLLVNEADYITPQAAMIWLDALESLPPLCVVIFTTNDLKKLPARLRDRFTFDLAYEGDSRVLRPAVESLARDVWRDAGGTGQCPPLESFGRLTDDDGNVSFRRLVQRMEPYIRTGTNPTDERMVAA